MVRYEVCNLSIQYCLGMFLVRHGTATTVQYAPLIEIVSDPFFLICYHGTARNRAILVYMACHAPWMRVVPNSTGWFCSVRTSIDQFDLFTEQRYCTSNLFIWYNTVAIKVLNSMERCCPSFPMKWDVPQSHPVLTLRTADVPRHPNQDARMMTERSCSDT